MDKETRQVLLNLLDLQMTPSPRFVAIHIRTGALLFAEKKEGLSVKINRIANKVGEWEVATFFQNTLNPMPPLPLFAQGVITRTLTFLQEHGLQDLSSLQEEAFPDEVRAHPAFHPEIMSRWAAEKLLLDKPVGVYLIRYDDTITETVKARLITEEHLQLDFYILSYSEGKGKIGEKLLIKNEGWFIYNDEVRLKNYAQRACKTLVDLLASMSELKSPVH